MNLLIIGFHDRQLGLSTLDEAELIVDKIDARVRDIALACRGDDKRVRIHRTSYAEADGLGPRSGILGLLTSLVIRAGATPPVAAGGVLSGVIAGVGSEALRNETMRSLASVVHDYEAVLLALGPCEPLCRLREDLERYGSYVRCDPVPTATVGLIREISKLSAEDLQHR